MEARELRIDSWIQVTALIKRDVPQTREVQVTSKTFELCEKYPEKHSPIPLTEEWLEKFGFEKEKTLNIFWAWNLDRLRISKLEENDICDVTYTTIGDLYLTIQSVHQLQNLYFALTGQELEIK